MDVTCPNCGAETTITVTGRSSYQLAIGHSVVVNCKVIRERMAANGGKTSNTDCDHLGRASSDAFDRLRRRYG